jgi:hypothetical protein
MIANEASGENGSPTMRRLIAATVLATTAALGAFTAIQGNAFLGSAPLITGCCRG